MAKSEGTQVLMKVVRRGGIKAIPAECQIAFGPGARHDDMLLGFDAGHFFEISEFGFGLGGGAKSGDADAKRVDLQPVTFSRMMDRASLTLLSMLFTSEVADSAAIVKCRGAGTALGGEPFVRLDFGAVLFTKVDWDDEPVIKERCTLIARSVMYRYRPQLNDGSMGAVVQGAWQLDPAAPPPQPQ